MISAVCIAIRHCEHVEFLTQQQAEDAASPIGRGNLSDRANGA